MKRTLLVLSWLFAGGLCVKAEAVKNDFKLKRRTGTNKNVSVKSAELAGGCIVGNELADADVQPMESTTTVYGSVVSGSENSTGQEFVVKEQFSATDTVTIDRSMLLGSELDVEDLKGEPSKSNKLYVEHIAKKVVVGDELGIVDEITREDGMVLEPQKQTAHN